jgi:hypothetical protein
MKGSTRRVLILWTETSALMRRQNLTLFSALVSDAARWRSVLVRGVN